MNMEEKIVLCGANAYDKKYYFNQQFDKIPDSIKDELHIICVLFTEEVGGIITLAFDEEGTLVIETNAADEDYYYDEVSSGLLVREIRRKKQELFESLSLYYRVVILGEYNEFLGVWGVCARARVCGGCVCVCVCTRCRHLGIWVGWRR